MSREAFEKWNHERDSNTLTKLNTGEYANAFTAACWAAWQAATAAAVPPGYKLVPVEPTEAQWGGLARDIVWWLYAHGSPHTGHKLHAFLRNLGRYIPDWLTEEIHDSGHTPPKGTVAAVIYRAMLEAAPKEQ